MPPTLASLVHHSALKLTVRAGEDRLDVPVRWAHASELADPVPYMEGGELLLITALKLDAEDPEAMRRYVRRLVGAGVAGLGFAVGVHYEDIPEALVDAARGEGLPLLEVPRRTPFLAISKAVSAAISAEQYRAVTAGFAAQRELTKQALTDGPEGLLAALASQVDGWAALYDASGAVVAVAPEWAERRAGRLTADVERLRDRPAPASAVVGGEDRVELHSLGTGRRARAALAVGTAGAPGTAERYAVHSAIALLTLTTERSRSLHAAEQRIAAAVLRMLLAGECDHARAVAGDLYGELLDAPFRLVLAEAASASAARARMEGAAAATGAAAAGGADAVDGGVSAAGAAQSSGAATAVVSAAGARPRSGPGAGRGVGGGDGGGRSTAAVLAAADPDGDLLGQLVEVVEAAAARAGEAVLVVPDGERLVVLAVDGGAAVAACGEFAVALEASRAAGREPGAGGSVSSGVAASITVEEEELVVGLSAPAGPIAAGAAYKQAEQALSVARRRGRCLVEHEELAAGSVLPLLADDAVRAFADSILRPLREHDATGRGDLVASLGAWLSRHGQWDAAAADLGVHRHTLRYRMRRVEEILGRSLDDPDARMELWLALKATAAAGE
ncbi:PucR family transcriptional regulator [Streptomyces sp. DSM 40750]|uniref:PucR family transcriptional regulator n=1 Tax=Streptomyces sp. DSM 40750 TaxID=2801030 RepID=UPI00214AC7DF|nr:PucR family transcriptional regulator [Streptomyces sp. DSM 40750]UUU25264.1 PucR family transcriptional regulator [Streptomyces sp. DSM 40750]